MVKLKYYVAGPSDEDLTPSQLLYIDYHSGTSLTILGDDDSELKLVMTGKNLAYDGSGFVVGGVVETITYGDKDGAVWAKFTDLHVTAADFRVGNYFTHHLIPRVLDGNDKITGSSDAEIIHGYLGRDVINGGDGNDQIYGDEGSDRLTGGKGSDMFYMSSGKDVITDFDAVGGGDRQDYINGYGDHYALKQKGHDLLVTFDSGYQVTLLDTKASQVDDTDFIWQ